MRYAARYGEHARRPVVRTATGSGSVEIEPGVYRHPPMPWERVGLCAAHTSPPVVAAWPEPTRMLGADA